MTCATLAPEDIEQLWIEYKKDMSNQELRNRLVEMYLPLVKYNGERIWARLPEGVELDDLISAGVFGLMDAIDAFDLSRGVKFETYCVPRIRGAMLDELRTMDWVPRLVRSKASKLNEALKTLEARLGRPEKLLDVPDVHRPPELSRRLLQHPPQHGECLVHAYHDGHAGPAPEPLHLHLHLAGGNILRRDAQRQVVVLARVRVALCPEHGQHAVDVLEILVRVPAAPHAVDIELERIVGEPFAVEEGHVR